MVKRKKMGREDKPKAGRKAERQAGRHEDEQTDRQTERSFVGLSIFLDSKSGLDPPLI